MFGIMIDCSRNAVMKSSVVKKWADLLGKMGYDALMLYTEDTYEVENQPLFGYQRGRYTKEELKELDAYCTSKGIELIPCIQTLAHLNGIFKWHRTYGEVNDCDDILLIGEEKTYQLLRDMFASLAECFTSRRIHIGMDEAYHVGLGAYLQKHGYEERFELIQRHLHKVCEIAAEYGFQTMIWSDMFCKLALGSDDYYKGGDLEAIRKKADLPENVSLVYWDYYSTEYEHYKEMLEVNGAFGKEVVFAGGAWTWKGFVPDNQFSIATSIPAIKACREYGVKNYFVTIWGDDGGECSRYGVLPALYTMAQLSEGKEQPEEIRAGFKALTGMEMESFLLPEQMDWPQEGVQTKLAKTLFYNDPFIGLMDCRISGGENQYYAELKEKLDQIEVSEEYRLYFQYIRALCDVLTVKSELGVRTRNAYQEKDLILLRKIAQEEYTQVIEKTERFHAVYQEWWMSENKPQGFEVQDIRIGGLLQRLKSCQARLLAYCSGSLESIPELEEAAAPESTENSWARVVTPGVISHQV